VIFNGADVNRDIGDGFTPLIIGLKLAVVIIFLNSTISKYSPGVEIQALFEDNGDKTNFTFNVIHPTEEYYKQQEKMGFYNGWGSAFDRLETFIITLDGKH
jgi:uncharacterized protein YndB with AHSA1/START domain